MTAQSSPPPADWRQLPRYDAERTYDWNYDHPPSGQSIPASLTVEPLPGEWTLAGWRLPSPLGVPAGPLLNGAWCRYYAALGFDVVTYKTVRSGPRACYPPPNVLPVEPKALRGGEGWVPASAEMEGTWAVSYGMPSKSPEVWRADVRETRDRLPDSQRLVVSVVGTIQPGWSLEQLADDYAWCAAAAAESGADAIECNFSCPNVDTCDGQLYQDPVGASLVAGRVRERIGRLPLFIKVGHIPDRREIEPLLTALGPSVQGIAATNSIAARVRDAAGRMHFEGQPRGICGSAILDASVRQIGELRAGIERLGLKIELIGVGGASTAADVRRYLDAGAAHVQLATAAMIRPYAALAIRRDWTA